MKNRPFLLVVLLLAACGGGGQDPAPPAKPARVLVVRSDTEAFEARVLFPAPRWVEAPRDGRPFERMFVDGLEVGGESAAGVGHPAVPTLYRLLALPIGAQPTVEVLGVESTVKEDVLLFPAQVPPVDGGEPDETLKGRFGDAPFAFDEDAYEKAGPEPEAIVTMLEVGRMRDLRLLQVQVAAGRYEPVLRRMTVHREVRLRITYGGQGVFLPQAAGDPFERSTWQALHEGAVLNGPLLYAGLTPPLPGVVERLGAELLILTAPDIVPTAEFLALWKREKGIPTQVFAVGPVGEGGIGETAEEIQAFLQDRYDHAVPRFSYVLLLGDVGIIPTWNPTASGSTPGATDLDYALLTPGDATPDVGLARIPVENRFEAADVLGKIIEYEQSPPVAPSFYRRVGLASYFQAAQNDALLDGVTSRGFIENAERVRGALLGRGYTVRRIYASDTSQHEDYLRDPTPRHYIDERPLPADIGPASGFAWDASTADIVDAFEDGCALMVFRGHGAWWKAVSPRFGRDDVPMLRNGPLFPVLFSMNCSTGRFDIELDPEYAELSDHRCLIETLLRPREWGVVGAIASTRDTPHWGNNALFRGVVDAVVPDLAPDFGGSTPVVRLADILNHGKLYMFHRLAAGDFDMEFFRDEATQNNVLWHAFGDPTLELWTENPIRLPDEFQQQIVGGRLIVEYAAEAATITATVDGRPLGRSVVKDGVAVLDLLEEGVDTSKLELSASRLGAIGRRLEKQP